MSRFAILLAVLAAYPWAPSSAEDVLSPGNRLIRPDLHHYAAAADAIAASRAADDLLAYELRLASLRETAGDLAELERLLDSERRRLVEQHARRVQAWAGLAPHPAAGDGWHQVHRRGSD